MRYPYSNGPGRSKHIGWSMACMPLLNGQWPVCHCSVRPGNGWDTTWPPSERAQDRRTAHRQARAGGCGCPDMPAWLWRVLERRGHMTRPGRRRGRAGSALLIFGHRMVTRPCHIRHIRAPPAPSRVSSNRRARHRSRAGEKDAVSYRPPGDRDDAAGREPPGWYVDPRSYLDPTGQQVLRWWDGTKWSQQTRPMPGRWQGPPIAQQPSGRQPWPRRYKVVTVLGSLAVLIIVIAGWPALAPKPGRPTTLPPSPPPRLPERRHPAGTLAPTRRVRKQCQRAPRSPRRQPPRHPRQPPRHPRQPPPHPWRPLTPPRRHLQHPLRPPVVGR